MAFSNEGDFERALITVLFDKGWSHEVIKYPTEKELIRNWADILYRNNWARRWTCCGSDLSGLLDVALFACPVL